MWVEVGWKRWYYFNPQLWEKYMIDQSHLDNWFQYHAPAPEQIIKSGAIRDAGKALAECILENTPPSADQSDAIRSVRNAVMTANAAIACDGK